MRLRKIGSYLIREGINWIDIFSGDIIRGIISEDNGLHICIERDYYLNENEFPPSRLEVQVIPLHQHFDPMDKYVFLGLYNQNSVFCYREYSKE